MLSVCKLMIGVEVSSDLPQFATGVADRKKICSVGKRASVTCLNLGLWGKEFASIWGRSGEEI